jgi:hypothetical protein
MSPFHFIRRFSPSSVLRRTSFAFSHAQRAKHLSLSDYSVTDVWLWLEVGFAVSAASARCLHGV